jgi:hypothetical protein
MREQIAQVARHIPSELYGRKRACGEIAYNPVVMVGNKLERTKRLPYLAGRDQGLCCDQALM